MMKTEYTEKSGFLQRDGVEHEEYAEACSTECQKVEERDGADLLEKVLAGSGILTNTITNKRLAYRGYYDISEAYKSLHYL